MVWEEKAERRTTLKDKPSIYEELDESQQPRETRSGRHFAGRLSPTCEAHGPLRDRPILQDRTSRTCVGVPDDRRNSTPCNRNLAGWGEVRRHHPPDIPN